VQDLRGYDNRVRSALTVGMAIAEARAQPLPAVRLQADIYSVGILALELIHGDHPYGGLELPHVGVGRPCARAG
jgi:hypothetical protein